MLNAAENIVLPRSITDAIPPNTLAIFSSVSGVGLIDSINSLNRLVSKTNFSPNVLGPSASDPRTFVNSSIGLRPFNSSGLGIASEILSTALDSPNISVKNGDKPLNASFTTLRTSPNDSKPVFKPCSSSSLPPRFFQLDSNRSTFSSGTANASYSHPATVPQTSLASS